MFSKAVVLMTDSFLGQPGQFYRLQHRHLTGPAPKHQPEFLVGQSQVAKPRVREQRELGSAASAAIPTLKAYDTLASALRTKEIFTKDNTPQILLDLCF